MAQSSRSERPVAVLLSIHYLPSDLQGHTYRTTISNAVRGNNAESQLEEVWDLVPPCHRQVREAMNLESYQ